MLNSKIIINGNGSQTRSFCYVSDIINGLISLMESDFKFPMNIGNNKEITINDLAKKIISKFNKSVEIEKSNLFLEEPNHRKPSIKLAQTKLNWTPLTDLDEGLNSTIKYFVQNNKF